MDEGNEFIKAREDMVDSIEKIQDELDRSYLRKLQQDVHLCSANCYNNPSAKRAELDECEEKCKRKYYDLTNKVYEEFSLWQEQMNRCITTCQDKQLQKYGTDTAKYTEEQRKKFTAEMSKCAKGCVDDHVRLLPKVRDRLVGILKK